MDAARHSGGPQVSKNHTPIERLLDSLDETARLLISPELQAQLSVANEAEAEAIRGGLLSGAAFLDESVSCPYPGSLFDLWTDTPLNRFRRRLAKIYSVKETIAGTNGTTGLNVPAVMSLAGESEKILIGRDAHVSISAATVLSGASPVYFVPRYDERFGVTLPPTPSEVAAVLNQHPDARAAVFTLPTYLGVQGDVAGIVRECRRRGVRVMVDAAHGPHYELLKGSGFPPSAESAGADIITESVHKLMSALNQASVIHFNDLELLRRYEELQSLGFVSTSFSFPILVSVEHAVNQMLSRGPEMWTRASELAQALRNGAAEIPGVEVLDQRVVDGARVIGLDPTRVTVNVRLTGLTGFQVADSILEAGGIVEMATPDIVLFLVSPSATGTGIDRTITALRRTVSENLGTRSFVPFAPPLLPERILTPRQATLLSSRQRVPVCESIGRVSGETIACYPPGQAVIMAGERITTEVIDYLTRAVAAGAHLKRVRDDHFRTMEVIRDEAVSSLLSTRQR
jgi:ornithine decarboxylase